MQTDTHSDASPELREPSGPDSFAAVVEEFWSPVMRFFWLRTGPDAAQDLAQTVFLNAHRRRLEGGGPTDTSAGWGPYLLRSARNLWIDEQRRDAANPEQVNLEALLTEAEEREAPGVQSSESVTQPLLARELQTAVQQCLQELDVLGRCLCWMHFVQGTSVRRIARALARPESTLRLNLSRALEALRSCLTRKDLAPEEGP